MRHAPYLPKAHVDLARIRANCRLLLSLLPGPPPASTPCQPASSRHGADAYPAAGWPSLMPVVKADAYGHGHIETAAALLEEGASFFASGSVQEAVLLRQGLAGRARSAPGILSLLGLVEPDDVALCLANGIIPLVHTPEQLALVAAVASECGPFVLPVALKCNTGMSRLGFDEAELPHVRERLRTLPVRPVLAVSHLHSADEQDGREQARGQARVFARFLAALREDWPDVAASLGNSAGAFFAADIADIIGPHVCRPGLALYGCNPFHGTGFESLGSGLAPAMSVRAPILARRTLAPGDGIGYGHAYRAEKRVPVGIVGAGYSDCYARSLTNKGSMCIGGVRVPVIGRVAMQMTAVDLSALPEGIEPPRSAWLLGGPHAAAVSPEELAELWGTIPYEVFCLLGRNERAYGPYPKEEPDGSR